MKAFKFGILTLLLSLYSSYTLSQTIVGPYEVATWQNFSIAAVSYTYDDNCSNQLGLAVPMFDEYNFKLTLFTVTNWSPNWNKLQQASDNGHEIASHTVAHVSISGIADSLQLAELKNSKNLINSHISGDKCVTIAYPYCNTGKYSLVSQYYFAARGCQGYVESKTPSDFNNISSIICGSQGSVKTTVDFTRTLNSALTSKGWCVYLIHGINNDGGYSPLQSDTLRASLEYLKANQDKFWVAPFGTVAKYIRERNSLSVSETVQDNKITVQVSDTLDNAIFDCPVTVRRTVPEGWDSVVVLQNEKIIEAEVVIINSIKYLMFDAVPDNGEIIISNAAPTGVDNLQGNYQPGSTSLEQNYPNPFNPSTKIEFSIGNNDFVELKIYDQVGKEIDTLVSEQLPAGSYEKVWNAKNMASGVYYYNLRVGERSFTQKLVVLR